uniref:Lipid-binding serum glycoprotein C-terminal domain-containing protein n=1 Tax=Panagrolaimus superbus TaxID=310955 RepID=A0A914YHP6_9BILA
MAGLEIDTFGEVSLRGRGGTPFGAVSMALPPAANAEAMLQMAVSDFVPNSLMYHGHTIGLFNTRIDPSTPHFGAIMKTTCSLSSGTLFCLGDLFPTLRKLHANRKLSMIFNTVQAPVIQFKPSNAGGIHFSLLGKITIFLIDEISAKEEQVAEMSIEVTAQMKLRLSSNTVRPKISLHTIELKTLSPGILLQKELDDSVLLAREVLQRMVNDILKEGIPIPVHPLFRLNKPKVKVLNRALLLQTDFDLNERLLRQLTAADLRKRVI